MFLDHKYLISLHLVLKWMSVVDKEYLQRKIFLSLNYLKLTTRLINWLEPRLLIANTWSQLAEISKQITEMRGWLNTLGQAAGEVYGHIEVFQPWILADMRNLSKIIQNIESKPNLLKPQESRLKNYLIDFYIPCLSMWSASVLSEISFSLFPLVMYFLSQ